MTADTFRRFIFSLDYFKDAPMTKMESSFKNFVVVIYVRGHVSGAKYL